MTYQIAPIPRTKEETVFLREQYAQKDAVLVNIFDYFSKDILILIKKSMDAARIERSAYLTPWHLLLTLVKDRDFKVDISPENLHILSLESAKTLEKNRKNSYLGIVFFSPEVKKVLLGAYFVAKQGGGGEVTKNNLLSALSVYPEMVDLFTSIDFIPSDTQNFYMPKSIAEFATDLTGQLTTDKKTYLGREDELENTMRILARENKHDVILLGDEGVGKSVIGNGLASYLSSNKFPNFTGARVIALNIGAMFSMTSGVGSRIQGIIEEISSLGNIIFFLENASMLTTNIQISQLVDFLQSLDRRGNVFFIMPITPAFYKEQVSENPYLLGFFDIVHIEELSADSTLSIIQSEASRVEKYYRIKIDPAVFTEVVNLSKRYLPGRLPQKAISLLEEAGAGSAITKNEILTVADIRSVVSKKTGIPLNSLTASETEKLKNLENLIANFVVGQKNAIQKVSEALRRSRAGLSDVRKPIGSFLFLGPTGVGKTELAKTLAKLFFNDEKSFLRFDMSEYAESHTAQRLIGAPPGYVGYEEGGQLTNLVIVKPYSLILFDEIEKAHPRVFDLFLQILDDGRLTDSQGKVVDFRNTLIIFTSNIASREIFDNGQNLIDPNFDRKKFFESSIMPVVREYFRPELVNRFDDIVMFNPLTKEELIKVARLKIKMLQEKLKDKNITFEISDDKLKELVASSFNPAFGARPLEREIKDKIESDLAKKIISGEITEGEKVIW